ncbi:reverse transcriptase domain-containing protein [Tanacetum coccineum]|uniref:Reverse transcriptase domain-containing protein n=1 Tax=Tanacetum coccineum TaxID=301880 RepID=A0ABQ5B231_9ASTR
MSTTSGLNSTKELLLQWLSRASRVRNGSNSMGGSRKLQLDVDLRVAQGLRWNAGGKPDNFVAGYVPSINHYAYILFDTGADRSFVSTTFSTLLDIVPNTLDHGYNVELADGRIIGVNTILMGCTLNFRNHPFNINLMPVEMGSFDVIIGMDWLSKYSAVIDCAKKIVRIPSGSEILIVRGDGCSEGHRMRLNVISCTKTHCRIIGPYESELLKKEELYAKFSKCEFWIPKVQFLGHVIDSEGIHVDPAKIESIKDWTSPKSPTGDSLIFRVLLGTIEIIEGFSRSPTND